MRVTIDIPDEIHARLKARAKAEGTTMRAIILRGIDAILNCERALALPERKGRLELPLIRSKRPATLKL